MKKQDSLFDWKHARLWRFSSLADFASSVVIVIYLLLAIGEVYQYNSTAHTQYQTNLIGLFSQYPVYIFDVSLQMARVFLQGVVYYLVLKGVALGLSMIVETDLNYRDREMAEAEDE